MASGGPVPAPSPSDPVGPDPIEEWLCWEEQANLVGFRTSTAPVVVPVARVDAALVSIDVAPEAPRAVVERFLGGGRVAYPRHPLNCDASVTFGGCPVETVWTARFTSSRTLVVRDPPVPLFSIKISTDHPHPDFHQPEKVRLREEAEDAVRFARLIERVDALLGPDPSLRLVRECLTVLAPGTEHGFVVRDLSCLQDGHRYLPALSLPFAGRVLAARLGLPFEGFWERHYAAAVGRAKARLLARYGLQYETPNPQNLLIQLDAVGRPTGVVVLRDLGDAVPATDALGCADRPWTRVEAEIRPETRNSFWAFDAAGDDAVPDATLERWLAAHDRAFAAALVEFFGLDPGPLPAVLAALASPDGRSRVAVAFERRMKTAALRG